MVSCLIQLLAQCAVLQEKHPPQNGKNPSSRPLGTLEAWVGLSLSLTAISANDRCSDESQWTSDGEISSPNLKEPNYIQVEKKLI